ncbi:hypothetical protein HOD61_02185 [archaeon]|nr:hypothetical protein [archaeon]
MKKSIIIVDLLLVGVLLLMPISKMMDLPIIKIIQLTFFILVIIHIIQHWKILIFSIKRLIKK